MKTLLLICSFISFGLMADAQKVYYVRQDATGTGTSWDDASGDLQAMINKASEGDSIFTSAGKYVPARPANKTELGTVNSDNPDNAFVLKKGVKMYGGFADKGRPTFADRNWKDNVTILSGDIGTEDDNSDNVYHVVISVGDDKNTVLDGFTITGGMAREVTPYYTLKVEGKDISTNYGGGLYNHSSSPTINNITFDKNQAFSWGGGLYNTNASSPVISHTSFTENAAQNGGGLFNNTSSSPEISHTIFSKNTVNSNGGAMDNEISSSPKITYCTFSENFANKMGGAIANYSHSSPQITNSLFINNSTYGSLNSPVASGGGAMYNNYACLPVITNSTFAGNKVTFPDGYGGSGAALTYNNPDILGYDTAFSGGKIYNCIFWDSIAPNDYNSSGFQEIYVSQKEGPLAVSNCVIQGYGSASYSLHYTATSFVLADPMFTDPDKSDFSLQQGSPAVDVGLNTAYPGGVDSLDTAVDLAGAKRLVANIVDMGAYEYQGTATLSQFAAKAVGDSILIRWNTSAKAKSFNVLRSDDGTHFTSIATVTAAIHIYTDNKPSLVHTNYYRIKQIDTNNDSSFSAIVPVTFRYVKTDGLETGNGFTWATASNDLQAVLNKAVAGDEVRVAAGTYKPSRRADSLETVTSTDRNNAFVLKDSVNMYGGFPAKGTPVFSDRNWNSNPSVLSGNIGTADSTDNTYHVVISVKDTVTTLLDGFTISGGNADGNNSITVKGTFLYPGYGGGMLIINSSPAIVHTTFSGNTAASEGGGMFISKADGFASAPVISNCIYTKNVTNTGGGLYTEYGSPAITNTLFTKNTAFYSGGAIVNGAYSKPVITNVTVAGNTANTGGGMFNSQSTPVLRNSIVYGNNTGVYSSSSTPSYQFSLMQGINSDTSGNIRGTTSPLFTDSAKGDYTLQYFSPAVNAGSNNFYSGGQTALTAALDLTGNKRLIGAAVDMGAYEYPKTVDNKKDSIGNLKLSLAATGDTVFISWSAITSDSNAVFNVQHSTDGVHFVTIKTVNGNKKTGTPSNYNTIDDNPINGVNYYRIEELFMSGKDSVFSTIEHITASVRQPVIRYVKPGAAGDGSSWQKASGDLQAMINAADRNDEIWVAAGTYKPNRRADALNVITPANRHNSFVLKTHVRIYGGFAGGETDTTQRNWTINKTILSGDFNDNDGISGSALTRNLKLTGNDENATNVVISVNDDGKTILDGFIITGGYSNFVQTDENPSASITVEGAPIVHYYYGAGMYNYASSPTLSHLTFTRNESQNDGGGGMYNILSSPVISNCAFIENNTYGNGGNSSFGGAMYNMASSPSIIHTTFTRNMCWYVGGAIATISNNYNYPDNPSVVTVANCSFTGNAAGNGFGADESSGGAIDNRYSSTSILNSVFNENQAGFGGAISTADYEDYDYIGNLTITNSTFYGNSARSGDGVGNHGGGAIIGPMGPLATLNISNTIIYGNNTVYGDSGVYTGNGPVTYQNSLVQGIAATTGTGNIAGTANPLFTDAANGDFTLQSSSPVINKGNNALYPGGQQAWNTAVDLADMPRIVGNAIDMGAFEFQQSPLSVILQFFTAKADKQAAVLQWQTATETNNSHFDIERSGNGINFKKIGSIEGHGTTSNAQLYNFTDVAPLNGNNYYRLAQVDFDGRKNYSGIRLLLFGDVTKQVITLFPNPAKEMLHVQFSQPVNEAGLLQLYNIKGYEVLRKAVPAGTLKQDINISSLAAGVYIFHFNNQSIKIVKQ